MSTEERYNALLAENVRLKKLEVNKRNLHNWLQIILILLVIYFAFDFYLRLRTMITTNDEKRDAWISEMNNITELHRQQLDSLRRLNDSVKINCWRCKHK